MFELKSAHFFQMQSSIIVALMLLGVYLKKNRSKHIPIMLTVIIWDIFLILQIELNRKAVAKATKMLSNPTILNIHVLLAISTVVFYFIMIYTGREILKKERQWQIWHKRFGLSTVLLRLLTYITSFFVVS